MRAYMEKKTKENMYVCIELDCRYSFAYNTTRRKSTHSTCPSSSIKMLTWLQLTLLKYLRRIFVCDEDFVGVPKQKCSANITLCMYIYLYNVFFLLVNICITYAEVLVYHRQRQKNKHVHILLLYFHQVFPFKNSFAFFTAVPPPPLSQRSIDFFHSFYIAYFY